MGRQSLYRYQKEHFAKLTLKREVYKRLLDLAHSEGLSANDFIAKVLEFLDSVDVADIVLEGANSYDSRATIPIPYFGGDYYIKNQLLEILYSSGCSTLVEVFGGGGVISQFADRRVFNVIVYNDIDNLVVNFFTVLRDRPKELMRKLILMPVSRAFYFEVLDLLRSGKINELDPVTKAAYYFYAVRTSFNSGLGRGVSVSPTVPTARKFASAVKQLGEYAKRWVGVFIENRDFRELIPLYDRATTVFYLDPPYIREKSRYYTYTFTTKDLKDLLQILDRIKGKFLLKIAQDHMRFKFFSRWVGKYNVRTLEKPLHSYKSVGNSRPTLKLLLVSNY